MAIYLLWESATPPTGWTIDTTREDKIIKAGSESVIGGGHVHEVITGLGGVSGTREYSDIKWSYPDHVHPPTNSAMENQFPPYHSLRLIKTDTLPQTLPDGVVGFSKTILDDWQAHADFADKYVFVKSQTPTSGGSASHTHDPPAATGPAPSDRKGDYQASGSEHATIKHTHGFSGTISLATAEPDFFCMQIIKALKALQKVPHGLIAMFDSAPSLWAGWKQLDIDGHIKQGTYGTTGGSPNHTHGYADLTTTTPGCTGQQDSGTFKPCRCDHTHPVTGISNANYTPPYTQFIFAEYVGNEVLLLGQYGSKMYSPIRSEVINVGDKVRLYPTSGGAKVAIKELWSLNDKITIKKDNV